MDGACVPLPATWLSVVASSVTRGIFRIISVHSELSAREELPHFFQFSDFW